MLKTFFEEIANAISGYVFWSEHDLEKNSYKIKGTVTVIGKVHKSRWLNNSMIRPRNVGKEPREVNREKGLEYYC